jgi:hypothetical protein
MTEDQLVALRSELADECLRGLQLGATKTALADFVKLANKLDRRLERIEDDRPPSVERRLTIASERRPTRVN